VLILLLLPAFLTYLCLGMLFLIGSKRPISAGFDLKNSPFYVKTSSTRILPAKYD